MKRRLLFFHHCGAIGGAGVSLLHILDSIDREKYEISVVCPKCPSDMVDEIKKRGMTVIETIKTPVIFPHYNGGIKYALSIRTFRNLCQLWGDKSSVKNIIKQSEADIVIVNSMTMFMIGKYAKRMGKHTICFHRETYQKGLFGVRSWIIKRGLSKYFDKVAFISKYDSNKTQPCAAQKYVICDKVDFLLYKNSDRARQRAQLGIELEDKVILYLGGSSKLKGGHVVLDAMNNIKDRNVKLLFVSNVTKDAMSTPMSRKEQVLATLGLSSDAMIKKSFLSIKESQNIIFVKTSNHPEEYYAAADLVVFPSTIAHQARPIYEAGIAGCPIVISDFEETREFAEDGKNVVTFCPLNSVELAQKIEAVLGDEELRHSIIENNRKQAMLQHDLRDLPREISELLEDL